MSRTAEPAAAASGGASVARVLADAERLGLEIDVLRLAEGTRTAEEAARACGCPVDAIVKSIVFRVAASDRHLLFLTSGSARVDPAMARALAGVELVKADAASIRTHTGFAIGGVSPLGHLTPIETWFDPGLFDHPLIWAAAGTPNHVFAIAPQLLQTAVGATVAEFTEARARATQPGVEPE